MANTKYGPVLTYKDTEEAKRLIGKKVVVSDCLEAIDNPVGINTRILTSIDVGLYGRPFLDENRVRWQFIREVIEEDKPSLMSNRQLAEWLARGNGQAKDKNEDIDNAGLFLVWHYIAEEDSDPVDEVVVIRSWDSDEWVSPTLVIYERDCGGRND